MLSSEISQILYQKLCVTYTLFFFPSVVEGKKNSFCNTLWVFGFQSFWQRIEVKLVLKNVGSPTCLVQDSLHHSDKWPESENLWTSMLFQFEAKWKVQSFVRKYDANMMSWGIMRLIYIYINMRFLPFNGRLRYLLYFSKFFPRIFSKLHLAKSGRHCLEDNFQTFLDDAELQKCGHAGAHRTYGTMLGRKVPYLLDGWDDRTVEAEWSLSINSDSWWHLFELNITVLQYQNYQMTCDLHDTEKGETVSEMTSFSWQICWTLQCFLHVSHRGRWALQQPPGCMTCYTVSLKNKNRSNILSYKDNCCEVALTWNK